MFGSSAKNAVSTYSKISIETGVLAADPHQLIMLLFDGAIKAISDASQQMQANKIPEKGRLITRAISIIESGLRASLNKKVGGELAHNLDALYTFLAKELLIANSNNDLKKMDEVKKCLIDLRDAWLKIAPVKAKQEEPVNAPVDALAPRKINYSLS